MYVSSSSDLARFIAEQPRKQATDEDNPFEQSLPPQPVSSASAASRTTMDERMVEFQARIALTSFLRNDLNGDGYVERDEFMEQNLAPRPTYQFKEEDVADTWSRIDRAGTDRLDQAQYTASFSEVFKVSWGRLDKPFG